MNQVLNEAFASPILTSLWRSKLAKFTLMHLVKTNPKIDWNLITDADIITLTGKEAAKINDKNVWKFWCFDGNPEHILMVTNSNAVFDKWFDVNKRTRTNAYIVGSSCNDVNVLNGYAENGKAFLNSMRICYIIDLAKLNANKGLTGTQAARKDARAGATVLMTDAEIKKQNLKRYEEAIRRSKVTDGSEFGLINSITKIFGDAIKKYSGIEIVIKLSYDSFIGNYISSYSMSIMECLHILNKVGFRIDAPVDFKSEFSDDYRNYRELAKNLISGVERVKRALTNPNSDYEKKLLDTLNLIINADKKYEEFVSAIPDADVKDKIITLNQLIRKVNENAKKALQNAHISDNLDNFDTFTMLIENITRCNIGSHLHDVIGGITYAMNPSPDDNGRVSVYDRLDWKVTGQLISELKRVDNALVAISKI